MTDLDAAIRARLEKIEDNLDRTPAIYGFEEVETMVPTLLAVLNLHEPHPSLPTECFRCDTGRPCKTVRVIAEKLGVEHD